MEKGKYSVVSRSNLSHIRHYMYLVKLADWVSWNKFSIAHLSL